MGTNCIDWREVTDRINTAYDTKHEELRDAMEELMQQNFRILTRSAKPAGVSIHTLKWKLKELGIDWNHYTGIKIVDGELMEPKTRQEIPVTMEERQTRIEKEFNRQAWLDSGRKGSPCRHCTNIGGSKNNMTCRQECSDADEYDLFISSGLSSKEFDRFMSGVSVKDIAAFSYTKLGVDTMRDSVEVRTR